MSDGWQFDGTRVLTAINDYIEGWFAGVIPDEVLTRRIAAEKASQEMAEHQRQARPIWRHG